MRRLLLSLLLALIVLVASTFGGMTIFGMHPAMAGMDDTLGCAGDDCLTNHHMDTQGMDCLDHCISVMSPASVTPVPFDLTIVFLTETLIALSLTWLAIYFLPAVERWREGIGKFLLHQHLATIVLRD